MENIKKIIKPSQNKIEPVNISVKTVQIPKFDELSSKTLTKDKYLSEFSTQEDKQKVIKNLGLGNNFKVVGEFDSVESLITNVPQGTEGEAYLVGEDVYCWSSNLNKFYKYGSEGASAYQIAVKNGFIGTEAEWLESLAKSKTKTIYELDSLTEEELYTILKEVEVGTLLYGTILGNKIPLDLAVCPNGYVLTFSTDDSLNIIKIQKIDNVYLGEWNKTFLI